MKWRPFRHACSANLSTAAFILQLPSKDEATTSTKVHRLLHETPLHDISPPADFPLIRLERINIEIDYPPTMHSALTNNHGWHCFSAQPKYTAVEYFFSGMEDEEMRNVE